MSPHVSALHAQVLANSPHSINEAMVVWQQAVERIQEIQRESHADMERLIDLNQQLEQRNATITKLGDEQKVLKLTLTDANQDNEAMKRRFATVQRATKEAEEALVAAKSKTGAVCSSCVAYESQLQGMRQEVVAMHKTIDRLHRDSDGWQARFEQTSEQLERVHAQLSTTVQQAAATAARTNITKRDMATMPKSPQPVHSSSSGNLFASALTPQTSSTGTNSTTVVDTAALDALRKEFAQVTASLEAATLANAALTRRMEGGLRLQEELTHNLHTAKRDHADLVRSDDGDGEHTLS
jgi:hypothetical protein